MSKIKSRKKLLVAFVLFLIILILKYPVLNEPAFWDGLLWMKSAEWISENNFNPILPGPLEQGGLDTGHPPLVSLILALAFSLFGKSLIIAHLIMICFAFLTLYFTYLLGSYLYNERVGLIAAALLLFSPLFFAQSGAINMDKALAAFTVMTIYFVLKEKPIAYLISGSFLVLSKEAGVFTIFAIVIYIFIKYYKKSKKELFKKCFFYSLPLGAFLLWVFLHKMLIQTGVSIGSPMYWKPITFVIFFRFLSRIKFSFFDNFHWVLTLAILISLSSLKNVIKSFNIKKLIFSIFAGILVLFLFDYGFKFLLNNTDLVATFLSWNKEAFLISGKNLEGILLSFYSYVFIFVLFSFVFFFIKDSISFKSFKNKKLIPILLTFLFYFLLLSWTFNAPRYHLPFHSLFFILGACALNKIFKKKDYIISAIIIILLITQWNSHSTESKGYLLERNMEYLDAVKTHKAMTDYIEKYFPDVTVLTSPWMTEELRYPVLGYIKNSISPLDSTHYDPENNYKNLLVLQYDDWYYYQCYLKKQCDIDNFIPNGKGDIRIYDDRYDEYLTLDDFDIFYYSPQAPYDIQPEKLIDDFNLILIKKFERNGKYAELYASRENI